MWTVELLSIHSTPSTLSGMVHLHAGLVLEQLRAVWNQWNGMWNGIVEWNTGMTFYPENVTFGGAMSYSTSMEVN